MQARQQHGAAQRDAVLRALRDDAVVVRKLALHQLGDELHASKAEFGLVGGELHFNHGRLLAFGRGGVRQQALQLDDGFARQDDLLPGHFHIQRGAGEGQAVAVSGHQAQALAVGLEQDAVEVVADVVHGHGKRHLPQQILQCFLRHAEGRAKAGRFLHEREVFGGQGLQGETAFAALEQELFLLRLQAHRLVGGHGAQNVDELAHAHGGGKAAFVAAQLGMGANLDFQIAGGELDAAAFLFQQHVGQHGQRVAALHDARHRLQGGQELVLRGFQDDHVVFPGNLAAYCDFGKMLLIKER